MKFSMDISHFTNFLQAGVILQISNEHFKLIWGGFSTCELDSETILDEKTLIYRPDFWDFSADKSVLCLAGKFEAVISRVQLLELLLKVSIEPQGILPITWQPAAVTDFTEQFKWSFKKFATGELIKSVPLIAQKGIVTFDQSQFVKALSHLVEGNHYGYTYGHWDSGSGYLGHTPELIMEWSAADGTLRTAALAGTQTAQHGNEAILRDTKILKEHQIVVDDLSEVINMALPDKKVAVSNVQILELKHLKHLISRFEVNDLNEKDVLLLLKHVHPSAALGMYPRSASLYLGIQSFTLQKRRAGFAAPFGFLTKENILVVAAIRGFNFTSEKVEIFSGCGVTQQSVLAEEITELENKRNSVKKMMGMNL